MIPTRLGRSSLVNDIEITILLPLFYMNECKNKHKPPIIVVTINQQFKVTPEAVNLVDFWRVATMCSTFYFYQSKASSKLETSFDQLDLCTCTKKTISFLLILNL